MAKVPKPADPTARGSAVFRVLVIGTALARDLERLKTALSEIQRMTWDMRRPLEIVFDDYPSGASVLAAHAAAQLGAHFQIFQPSSAQEALDQDRRWAKLLLDTQPNLVVMVWRGRKPVIKRTRNLLTAMESMTYEYDELGGTP